MNTFFKAIAATALIGAVFLPSAGQGAAFLKLGDIKGEATDSAHKDWLIIESISQSIHAPASATAGQPAGKRQHKPFVITKPVDKASPLLLGVCADGKTLPLVRLEFVTHGPRPLYYKVTFKNVIVSSYQASNASGETVPTDSFSLNYEEIKWTYTQFSPEGHPLRDHSFYWNLLQEIGEFDDLPAGSFRVSGGDAAAPGGGRGLELRWAGFEEFVYRIHGSRTAEGPYRFLQNHVPTADGDQEVQLPIDQPEMFFQIEKLAVPD